MSSKPFLQIAIPTFNRKDTVVSQVIKLLEDSSSYGYIEIVVSDNASNDGTFEALSGIHNNRLKVFKNNENLGYQGNFLTLLERVDAEYVLFLSDEDLVDFSCVKEVFDLARQNDCLFISSNVTADGKKYRDIKSIRPIEPEEYWRSSHYVSGLIFKKSLIEKFSSFYRILKESETNVYPQVALAVFSIGEGKGYWLGKRLVYVTAQLKTHIPSYVSLNSRLQQYVELRSIFQANKDSSSNPETINKIIKSHEDNLLNWILPSIHLQGNSAILIWNFKIVLFVI